MRRNRTPGPDDEDRAVSEVLSFVLVFAIIMTSVAVLSMTGFQAMEDYQEGEQLRNGERAMEALADNFNDVMRYDGIDKRHGELSLREGTVTTGDEGTEVTIEVNDETIKDDEDWFDREDESFNLGEFAYHYDDETIAYEGGGLIRESTNGGVVYEEPWFDCRSDTAIISLVEVDADDRSIQSSDGVGFTLSVENRTTETKTPGDADVTVSVENPEYDAWENDDWECDGVERIHVTIVTVDIEY
ncbi:hypothetical protein CV102_15250 [Natronococcus pandeyae]|uniref:Uncharacterized protein n=1 Tax=Natronococcus pandeyae TaxID=2055836 RepID=A0A8J8Q2F5_9EURY|nr:hypothetical protein [Natronococcus pandeyae]TYL37692.1 hypothetical protein CV102_15250 [Natronococcus pandeyae]